MKKIILTLLIVFTFLFSNSLILAQEAKITINDIVINDINRNPISKDDDGNVLFYNDDNFQLVYMPKYNHEFLIDIKADQFNDVKKEAEVKLIELLGVSKIDVCWLYVVITSSNKEDTEHWTKNYEPSFCSKHQSRRIRDKSTDVNLDGTTNTLDYIFVLNEYGQKEVDIPSDINGDMQINTLDLTLVIYQLGQESKLQL